MWVYYMKTDIGISKRKQKSEETKSKLLDAMLYIMDKYDYNTVTIRNICSVSGVSYGSFYNLFESKEDFLRYYLTSDFLKYKEEYYRGNTSFAGLSAAEKSIDIFVCCASYNIYKGVKFISAFYSPNNTTLCPIPDPGGKEYSFSPLADEARGYLETAKKEGLISAAADIDEIVRQYCYLFNGITFNWCISSGGYDIKKIVKDSFTDYLARYTV